MNWIKNAGLFIASIIIAIALVEIFARVALPGTGKTSSIKKTFHEGCNDIRDHGRCANPIIYRKLVKKQVGKNGVEKIIFSVINSIGEDGFRITPAVSDTNGNDNKIALNFFGGSFMFGYGLNDDETLPFFSTVLGEGIEARNYAFGGEGVHNAVRLLETNIPQKATYNILLTLPFHILRSDCFWLFTLKHPRYELAFDNGISHVQYRGKCEEANNRQAWVNKSKLPLAKLNKFLKLKIIQKYLRSSPSGFTQRQVILYQALIKEFVRLSHARGEKPVIMYMNYKKTTEKYLRAGYKADPMWDFFKGEKINFIDTTLPNTPEFYIHDRDRHPSAYANCLRASMLLEHLALFESNKKKHFLCPGVFFQAIK